MRDLTLDESHGDRFLVDRVENLSQPGDLQQCQAAIRYQEEMEPSLARLYPWIISMVAQREENIIHEVVRKHGPCDDPADQKRDDENTRHDDLERWKGLPQTNDAVMFVEVS